MTRQVVLLRGINVGRNRRVPMAAVKAETDKLTRLLESNTDLTREDKDLTEQVAELTKEIHAMLARR